ncbi:MAG TPA: O-antigen ligase family protein [Alphaproteobacteria bacterium]|nr:O-antigen ligase family protein [Alphaproteobacteria bacterium]
MAVALADSGVKVGNPGASYIRARAARLLDGLVAIWIFSGAFVFTEPSPYELMFFLVLAVALVGGFGLHRSTLGLLVIFVAFLPFATIAAFQVRHNDLGDTLIFQAVTIFLLFTGYFVANYVADAPQRRMRLIVGAYIATAVLSAVVGTLGYLHLIPGADVLTRYGRAKALFNDPNVYGPFLILPAMYLLQRMLLGNPRRAIVASGLFMVLAIGVFASFSRAAWGYLAVSAVIVILLDFFLVAQAREKVRVLILAMVGALTISVAIAGMLSIPAVEKLFEIRASAQAYDEGETGRFGRQAYAFEVALANPLGIGPNEFNQMRVSELPHNSYVNFILVYGWGGGLLFWVLMGTTVLRAVRFVLMPSPNRLLLIPLVAVFIPLAIEAAIIDMDHWRHLYLLAGLIWGVTATYQKTDSNRTGRLDALI